MSIKKPTLLTTSALAGSLLLSGSAFAAVPLAQGYMLGAQGAAAADKAGEARCGAAQCMDRMDTDKDGSISQAEFAAGHGGDGSKFGVYDANADGAIDASEIKTQHAAKATEGKCGEGKCGAAPEPATVKASMEGKCGEGKCGSK